MKIVSWNVNGFRSNIACEGTFKKNFTYDDLIDSNLKQLIDKHDADIMCFQETKCSEEIGSRFLPNDEIYPFKYWCESRGEARRGSGYSGTSIWCKKEPLHIKYELEDFTNDTARFIYIEYEEFALINMYVPNSGSNLEFRRDYWDVKLKNLMDSISKPFILTGDFNVVHNDIDIWNPKSLKQAKMPGLFKHERDMFELYLENYVDVFRELHPDKKEYTWWNTITKSRASNKGWRIDYFLIQKKFRSLINTCSIDSSIMGSDHCPIILTIV